MLQRYHGWYTSRTRGIKRRAGTEQEQTVYAAPVRVSALCRSNDARHRRARLAPRLQRVGLGAGGSYGMVLAEPWLRSGRWYPIRIQIFPDGRGGFAVDGQPLWRSDSPISPDRLYRVRLDGKSVRTRILVGPLEVWEGVRGDVDWSVLDRQDAASRTPR